MTAAAPSGGELVRVGCYQCGSQKARPYAEENGFQLVKCAGCGLLYVSPRPSDGAVSQGARTGLHEGDAVLDRVGHFHEGKVKTYLGILGRLFEPTALAKLKWLDIGCGHGELLVALETFAAFETPPLGLEPSEPKRKAARARGLRVEDETFSATPGEFGGISLLNVYSHLPNPVEALRHWGSWVRPGGYLLLQTGDTAGLPYRHHHQPFDLPDHLSFTNERLLRELLARVGFRVTGCVKLRHGHYPSWQFWKHPYRDMWLLAERRAG
ncbi:MAG TPA: class I SAM-dependent methyltransferase [Polyangiaceae bacterium]|jgi:SAM-dependent methyltransferase|nr:class I SAM-dependent methyltransferase [Polyangiaceae bacterium]